MFKKALALVAGLLVTLAAYAAGAQLRADHPSTYVVKKGDTLWSISARFLKKPWLWPEIWDVNQQVYNPHLIYPGDVLQLGVDNRLRVTQRVEQTNPIPTIPLDRIEPFLHDLRIYSSHDLAHTPYVVASEEDQPRAVEGQNVYARGLSGAPGQRFAVARPTHVYRLYGPGQRPHTVEVGHLLNSDVDVVQGPWQEDFRNDDMMGRGTELGTEVEIIGTVQMLRGGDPATLLLTNAKMEVRPGDRLLPVDDAPYDPTFWPHPARSLSPYARVLAFANGMDSDSNEGPMSVVALSEGSADGVNNGTTFSIFHPGDEITDDVAGDSRKRSFGPHVKLPAEFIGHVMVFRTFEHVSYGLVMDGIRPVQIGDELQIPE
ncbi:MAG TPA: LysM domain-containing protein [Rhodanobacteraceae bacterium]|nr:LysM domain-containing protein [Rhodanobacteraceae bacterium]